MRYLICCLLVLVLFASCSKKQDTVFQDQTVAIYTLSSYKLVTNQCRVDPASAVLSTTPLVDNADIVHYDAINYQYTLKDAAAQKVIALPEGTPLAMTLNKEVIFFFIVMPTGSPNYCAQSVTTSISTGTYMQLDLGFPGGLSFVPDDQRNNARLLNALTLQGKM